MVEQVFFQIASQVAIQLADPMEVHECAANCVNKCTVLSGKLWTFAAREKRQYRLFCNDACALSVMRADNLSEA